MKNKILLLISLLSPAWAVAQGGGWVGNSPLMVANNEFTYKPMYKVTSAPTDLEGKPRSNYLLNEDGEKSYGFGLNYGSNPFSKAKINYTFNFAYGITNRLTYRAPLTFDIGIVNNDGQGSEMAIVLGVPGLAYSNYTGLLIMPTLGLRYTVTSESVPHFRLITGVYLHKPVRLTDPIYELDQEADGYAEALHEITKNLSMSLEAKLIYRPVDWFAAEIGYNSFFSLSNTKIGSQHIYLGPTFYVTEELSFFGRGTHSSVIGTKGYGGLVGVNYEF